MFKKAFFWVFIALCVVALGGSGSVFFDAVIMPRLASTPAFANLGFVKHFNERVTIINKTEQVTVREDDPLEKIVSQAAAAVVTFVISDKTTGRPETGTGVLLTNDGLVAFYSNQPGDVKKFSYQAILLDGSVKAALPTGYDTLTHLAFFRLDGNPNTQAISFANSDDARIGKKVVALGYAAADYQIRAATGVIGDIDRTFSISGKTVASSEQWQGVFRPDIAGLDRFSGGPLVDTNGEMQGLVGTVSLDGIVQPFALPSNAVREALDRIIAGTPQKVFGAYYLPVTKALAAGQGLSRDQGALIYSPSGKTGLALITDAPAARAGLQVGDIITAIGGTPVTLEDSLPKLLSHLGNTEQTDVTIVRGGEEKTVSVKWSE
jgi:serine protease Do